MTVGGVTAQITTATPTALTVTLPAHAAGIASLVVTTAYGTSGALTVTYSDPPPAPAGG